MGRAICFTLYGYRTLAANRGEAARLQQVIADYRGKVDIVPTRESELVELTRDYGTM